MPRLHYSNHLESLIQPLAYELDKRDPFECIEIVVPNYSLEKWISLKIAQTNGIAANLRFLTLEKAIYEALQERLKSHNYDLLKKEIIHCLLMEILREKIKNPTPLWSPLKSYLSPKLITNNQAREHRLFQLSKRLTYLFQEYEFSRNEELINSWILGNNAIDSSSRSPETWQKELWNELFGPSGKISNYNKKVRESRKSLQPELYTLSQLYRICEIKNREQKNKNEDRKIKKHQKNLHVFGVSYLSQFHQKALTEQLSKFREINVYSLNPCMEFWEDVQSLGESKARILKNIESTKIRFSGGKYLSEKELLIGEELQFEEDNPFLQAWGKPGRENIRLLNQWSNWDFIPWFVEKNTIINNQKKQNTTNSNKNILRQIQQDILLREPRREKSLEMTQDESIIVLACSSPRREVEAVASLIWEWIQKKPDLMLNECAVIANDMEIYQHEIERVFEDIYNLPFQLIDGFSGAASRLEDAANELLGLCFTEYTRKDLFSLILNPFFLNSFENYSIAGNLSKGESIQKYKWMEWTNDLNVFYGIDSEWNKIFGYNHLENDKYSWEQAFNRLTTGNIISSTKDDEIFSIANKKIIPADIPQEWSVESARFILIVRSLIADTKDLKKWKMKAKDWACYIHILIKTYLNPSEKKHEEAFQNLIRNVKSISDLDLAQEKDHLFEFKTILEFFKQKQSSSTMHRGHYLAEGITVSSFTPMRPIPFKSVFLLGFGEGLFPSTFRKDTLDLRHIPKKLTPPIEGKNYRKRLLGDVSEVERDRYMFLETLISTRQNLVLSYVSKSDRTNEKLGPSSIIQTLIDELNAGYLKNKFEETIHPLKPYSLNYFPELEKNSKNDHKSWNQLPNYNFSAFSQARSLHLRKIFDKKFPGFERIPSELISNELKKFFGNNLISKNFSESETENSFIFSISNLRKFLETPLQTSISRLINFNDPNEEDFYKIEEPFLLDRLNEWSLLRKIWNIALNSSKNKNPEWNEFFLKYYERMELEGTMPSGIFKQAMLERHVRILKNWEKQLTGILNIDWKTLKMNICRFHFGPLKKDFFSNEIQGNNILKPAIIINNFSPKRLENEKTKIKGSSEWWYKDQQNNWYVIYLSEKESEEKSWLRHFLDVLILQLSGVLTVKASVTGLYITHKGKIESRKINIPSKEKAQRYFFDLIEEIKNGNTAEIMPVESVLELSKENIDEASYNKRYYNWIKEKMESSKNNLAISSKYGPVNFLEDFTFPDNPYQTMHRRFDLFFKTILI